MASDATRNTSTFGLTELDLSAVISVLDKYDADLRARAEEAILVIFGRAIDSQVGAVEGASYLCRERQGGFNVLFQLSASVFKVWAINTGAPPRLRTGVFIFVRDGVRLVLRVPRLRRGRDGRCTGERRLLRTLRNLFVLEARGSAVLMDGLRRLLGLATVRERDRIVDGPPLRPAGWTEAGRLKAGASATGDHGVARLIDGIVADSEGAGALRTPAAQPQPADHDAGVSVAGRDMAGAGLPQPAQAHRAEAACQAPRCASSVRRPGRTPPTGG